jgi:DNA-binding MarR family transcriptional regulator
MVQSTRDGEHERLLGEILSMEQDLYWHVRTGSFDHWLNIDVTMPQFKTLILVYGSDTATLRMGQIANALGVALSTATGIVDRLVEQGLLIRQEDPEDRRLVVIRLTERGHDTVERPHRTGQRRLFAVLERLSPEELQIVARALAALHRASREVAHSAVPAI